MTHPDDSTLSSEVLSEIRVCADRLLREASAYDVYPTPIAHLLSTARLSLDQAYSLDQNMLRRLYHKITEPILRAIDKVIGLLDARHRTIYLDQTIHPNKKPFVSLHEVGHAYLPWQHDTYVIMEDGELNLDPEIKQAFEREANVFACEVLFQIDRFQQDAKDLAFNLKSPLRLAKRYGASAYAAIRRYVATNERSCCVLVLDRPTYLVGSGNVVRLRRAIASANFTRMYGQIRWPDSFENGHPLLELLPTQGHKFTSVRLKQLRLGKTTHRFLLEAFDSSYEIFILLYPVMSSTQIERQMVGIE